MYKNLYNIVIGRLWVLILLTLSQIQVASGQTADKNRGCIPLNVQFDAPDASEYLWDFGDGTSSNKKEPEHVFTTAGTFDVKLYSDASQSSLIGTLTIIVYPDLKIEIQSDKDGGCNPTVVNFVQQIEKNNDILITGYLWAFGEGGSSTAPNPEYTYISQGLFDVSLAVETNFTECNKTIIVEDMIFINEVRPEFRLDKSTSCVSPATFIITNTSENLPGFTYEWDLGNGDSFSGYDPGNVTYTGFGVYKITLTMTSPDGCITEGVRNVKLGPPTIEVDLQKSNCKEMVMKLENNTLASVHIWDFGNGSTPRNSSDKQPEWSYETDGLKTVSYSVRSGACSVDTTFTILIDSEFALFTVEPQNICDDIVVMNLVANNKDMDYYIWNEEPRSSEFATEHIHVNTPKDSFFVNKPFKFEFTLIAGTDAGCIDSSEVVFSSRLAEAQFVPDSIIGFAPLTIGFNDKSRAEFRITTRNWNFGDGEVLTVGEDDRRVTHTFQESGEYYVYLEVEDEGGCVDKSVGTLIIVLGPDIPPSTGGTIDSIPPVSGGGPSGTGGVLCVGDFMVLGFSTKPFEDVQINTDEYRFDHCWERSVTASQAKFPGVFSQGVIYETQGFELERLALPDSVRVFGARADIVYEKTCDENFIVQLKSNSTNADEIEWIYDGEVISQEKELDFTLPEIGPHKIYLSAKAIEGDCQADLDSVTVYVMEPLTDFQMPAFTCAAVDTELDATASLDVTPHCAGYLWEFENQRPREVTDAVIKHQFLPGLQEVTLTVSDINGCTHSASNIIKVYGTYLEYELPELLCLPFTTDFNNTSTADTTIVDWEWNIGSTEKDPTYTFMPSDTVEGGMLEVYLAVVDAFGCMDTLFKEAALYEIESDTDLEIFKVCVGEENIISTTDTTLLDERNYLWDFGDGITDNGPSSSFEYGTSGTKFIQLIVEEKTTSCRDTILDTINVLARPSADFLTSADTVETLCYPYTIQFSNLSTTDGEVNYLWDFGNGSTSELQDPAISFDKGSFTTQLVIESVLGCSDSISQDFVLVGPEGTFTIDNDNICLGQDITLKLNLNSLEDVSSYTWDLGDGTKINDQPEISHNYNFRPLGDSTKIDLILRSAETGCEVIESVPININEVLASFEIEGGQDYCQGLAVFVNNSLGGDKFTWDLGDGNTSSEFSPRYTYTDFDDKVVRLTVEDEDSGCISTSELDISIPGESTLFEFPNLFSPNNDGNNDFFRPVVSGDFEDVISIIEFRVYDRWGQLVYSGQNLSGWDGRYQGNPAPSDVYAYFILLDIRDCEQQEKKGNVTLMR